VNLPVPPGSGDETFCSLVEHVAVGLARAYEPGLILVSAGFDAHVDDPLANCRVADEGFAVMAGSVHRLARDIGVPVGLVLEGGYDLDALARSVAAVLTTLGAPDAPAAGELEEHRLSAQARDLLAERWPALAG
jgi:acetoin utilization deacetylase AcuC-like enzyme